MEKMYKEILVSKLGANIDPFEEEKSIIISINKDMDAGEKVYGNAGKLKALLEGIGKHTKEMFGPDMLKQAYKEAIESPNDAFMSPNKLLKVLGYLVTDPKGAEELIEESENKDDWKESTKFVMLD